jgi:S-adenosylmethionine:tRNA ribosyltransferase-isomerase
MTRSPMSPPRRREASWGTVVASVLTEDFAYELPDELIAQEPAVPRDSCRLLVLDRKTGAISHEHFRQIIDHLRPGDLLVANETRVMPARLLGHKERTGGSAELLLLRPVPEHEPCGLCWECLVRPGRRLKPGARVEFVDQTAGGEVPPTPLATGGLEDDDGGHLDCSDTSRVVLRAEILEMRGSAGERLVRFEPQGCSLDDALHLVGSVPLPPYITDYHGSGELYQTVYSTVEHSAAAPTAGLHFTEGLLDEVRKRGVDFQTVELEVGVDTFRTVSEEDPTSHKMHTERYHVPQHVVDAVERTHRAGRRVIAVGTTTVRSLESAYDVQAGHLCPQHDATTSLFILPGYEFHVIDALITNFHVPRSTLMMLVSAFAGREHVMAAYEEAIKERYRFLSFGDAMLIE